MTTPHAQLLIGTYTDKLAHVDGKAPGILRASYAAGEVTEVALAAPVANPSWVTTSADGRFLYAVVETVEFQGRPGGGVAAFARDVGTGDLTPLNTAGSGGVEPAHLAVDPTGAFLLVANYRSGSVAVFALAEDGSLGTMVDHVQHAGSSVHPVRQTGPHAHQVLFDPVAGGFLVPDLGLDAVLSYTIDGSGHLTERRSARIATAAGAGPRHLAFHPDGQHLFLLTELDNTLVVLRRDGDGFTQTDVASTLPAGFAEHSQASAVRVSPSGRHVLTSNRGYDSVAVFAFDAATSSVELRHLEPSRGSEPRDLVVADPAHVLVANQDSDTVVTFALDESTSSLSHVSTVEVLTPVCLHLVS